MKFAGWYVFFVLCCGAALVAAGCGDDDVCGAINTGTIIIVDDCDFVTATPRAEGTR